MMEKRPVAVPPDIIEHVEEEALNVLKVPVIAPEIGHVTRKIAVRQFFVQQVSLVEE